MLIIDNQFLWTAEKIIDEAKERIDISTFKAEITTKRRGEELYSFFQKIIEKAKSGIKIRVLLNWHDDKRSVAKTNLYVMRELKDANIEIRYLKNNRCCHAKIILIDKLKAIIGSHNLSVRSTQSNFEISYLLLDTTQIKQLSDVFERSFYDAQKY